MHQQQTLAGPVIVVQLLVILVQLLVIHVQLRLATVVEACSTDVYDVQSKAFSAAEAVVVVQQQLQAAVAKQQLQAANVLRS